MLLLAAGVLAYANGLTGSFTYDDKAIVRDNPRLRAPSAAAELFTTQYFGGPPGSGTAYRPLLLLSFAVQWWIHGGEPVAFHAVNLMLHLTVTLLLAILFLRLSLPAPAAVGASLLFAVHPIHVEAVTSVVGRGETQAAALCVGFLLASLRFADPGTTRTRRRVLALALALACYAGACLTKESAVIAPALLFLCLLWIAPGTFADRAVSALRRGLPLYAFCAAALGGLLWARTRVLGGPLKSAGTGIFALENPLAPLAPAERLPNAAAIWFRYLGRMILPLRLSADESAWSIPLLQGRAWLGWACAVLLGALTVLSLWQLAKRAPAAFGFLWLAIASLPTSNLLFPTGTIFAERVAYLPSAGLCLIAAWALLGAASSLGHISGWRRAAFAAVALALACRTVIRNPVWASDEALFTSLVRASPESAKAHYDFAYMTAEKGDTRTALARYTEATEIFPGYWDAWAGRGRMEHALGNLSASEAAYAEAVRLAPFTDNGYFGMGLAREERGDRAGAERAYRDGLRSRPQSLPLAYRLALLLSAQSRAGAGHAWLRALAIEPGSLPARQGYAEWLARVGRVDEARAQLADVLRRGPRYEPALRLRRTPPFSRTPER